MKSVSRKKITEVQQLQAVVFWITLVLASLFSMFYLLN
jgi:hypothetical protein